MFLATGIEGAIGEEEAGSDGESRKHKERTLVPVEINHRNQNPGLWTLKTKRSETSNRSSPGRTDARLGNADSNRLDTAQNSSKWL